MKEPREVTGAQLKLKIAPHYFIKWYRGIWADGGGGRSLDIQLFDEGGISFDHPEAMKDTNGVREGGPAEGLMQRHDVPTWFITNYSPGHLLSNTDAKPEPIPHHRVPVFRMEHYWSGGSIPYTDGRLTLLFSTDMKELELTAFNLISGIKEERHKSPEKEPRKH
jgi:hypothetical protein